MSNDEKVKTIVGSCQMSSRWLVNKAEGKNTFPIRCDTSFTPFINAMDCFSAIEDAIIAAKKSIDIIMWAFDPSLKLKGPDGKNIRLWTLLKQKEAQGVQVRIMIWEKQTGRYAQAADKTADKPLKVKNVDESARYKYRGAVAQALNDMFSKREHIKNAKFFHDKIYNYAYTKGRHYAWDKSLFGYSAGFVPNDYVEDVKVANEFLSYAKVEQLSSSYKYTSSDELRERERKIRVRFFNFLKYKTISETTQQTVATAFTSEHQKIVLIDAEEPKVKDKDGVEIYQSVGFVMGMNLTKEYYSDRSHSFLSENRWDGFQPYQDMGSRLQGTVLFDLNDIVVRFWKDISGNELTERRALKEDDFAFNQSKVVGAYSNVLSQVCRTYPRKKSDYSIKKVYEKAINNATSYIYIENQYVRHLEMAEKITDIAKVRSQGRGNNKPQEESLYLFIVMQPPGEEGGGNTQKTMEIFGADEAITRGPKREWMDSYLYLVEASEKKAPNRHIPRERLAKMRKANPELSKRLDEAIEKKGIKQVIKDQATKGPEDTRKAEDAFKIEGKEGLKVAVGTLMTCMKDSKSGKHHYEQIYIHSKLLIVDDAFLTLGTANFNMRGFQTDNEINIAIARADAAKQLREELWKMHVGEIETSLSLIERAKSNYRKWNEKMDKNWENMHYKNALEGNLVYYYQSDIGKKWIVGGDGWFDFD